MWGHPLEHRKHTSDHKVKENWLSSAQKPSTEIDPQLGVGTGEPTLSFMPKCSLFWSCAGNHSCLGVHEFNRLIMSKIHCFTLVFHNLWLLQSFYLLFCYGLWAAAFVAEHSTNTCSLHFDQLRVSMLATVHYTKKCLWWGLISALVYGYKDRFRPSEQFDAMSICPFSRIIVVCSLPGLMSSPSMSSWLYL